jgi:hypothetical protein
VDLAGLIVPTAKTSWATTVPEELLARATATMATALTRSLFEGLFGYSCSYSYSSQRSSQTTHETGERNNLATASLIQRHFIWPQ